MLPYGLCEARKPPERAVAGPSWYPTGPRNATRPAAKEVGEPVGCVLPALRVLQLLQEAHQSEGCDSGDGGGVDGSGLGTGRIAWVE